MSTLGQQQVTENGDGNGDGDELQSAEISLSSSLHVFVRTARPRSDFHSPVLHTLN